MSHDSSIPDHSEQQARIILPTTQQEIEKGNRFQNKPATEKILQILVENSYDMLGLLDEKGNYLYLSHAVNEAFDRNIDRLDEFQTSPLLGRNCFENIHLEDRPRIEAQFQLLFNGQKKIQTAPYRVEDASGNWLWLEAIITNQLAHPDLNAIVVSARNISHQVELELKLKELQTLEAILEGEEKERSRIARDLHDEISGILAAAKMQFSAFSHKTPEVSASKEFNQGMNLLDKAAMQVRKISHNLMPEVLLENGLNEALNRYCCNISNNQLRIEYISIGNINRYSVNFELSVYRIAQELITNIIKHSKASSALVQLSQHHNILSLTIEDNGQGFNVTDQTQGTGLHSIRRRVSVMNGHFEIISEPGKGTAIYIEFSN